MVKAQAWLMMSALPWACAVYEPPDTTGSSAGRSEAGTSGVSSTSGASGSSTSGAGVSSAAGGEPGGAGAAPKGEAGSGAGDNGGSATGGSAAVGGTSGVPPILPVAGAAGQADSGEGGAAGDGLGGSAGAGGDATGCEIETRLIVASDTTLDAAKPNTNFGAATQLNVVADGAAASQRSLLRFDLSSIPAGAQLVSASLELQVSSSSNKDQLLELHRVQQAPARPWSEVQATWNKYVSGSPWSAVGGDFSAASASTLVHANTTAGSLLVFDVAGDVAGFVASPQTNFGWLIKDGEDPAGGSAAAVSLAARENATPGARPALAIRYCL
jgi:hypothetical protein